MPLDDANAGIRITHMKSAGSKYQSGRKGTEIGALIRAEIRAACKADGPLKGCKVSVRFSWSTHAKSIDIAIQAAPVTVLGAAYVLHYARTPHVHFDRPASERITAAGHAIRAACEAIAREYNRSDSDSQTDYFNDEFFCHVDFSSELEEAQRAQILAPHPACCGCSDCEDALAA